MTSEIYIYAHFQSQNEHISTAAASDFNPAVNGDAFCGLFESKEVEERLNAALIGRE